jgi:putative nucleotidyltransferase with HDIG domain
MSFKLYRDMRENYIETIQSLAEAIDAKDRYTRGHSERVAFYAVEIARKLGWSEVDVDKLQFLAMLHDIGKIGVREQVLNKRGRLTDEERREVNRHPELGAAIVEKVGFLRKEAGYVRNHHEHYSGAGYPDGLAGEEIPMGARIIAVADAFDAMTSQRVYNPSRGALEALEELKRCRGTQFDSKVVDAFDAIMAERTDILAMAREAASAEWSSLAGVD